VLTRSVLTSCLFVLGRSTSATSSIGGSNRVVGMSLELGLNTSFGVVTVFSEVSSVTSKSVLPALEPDIFFPPTSVWLRL